MFAWAVAVEQFYHAYFWNVWYARLTSDEVAKRVFDCAVNAGAVTAVRCLQKACNSRTRELCEGIEDIVEDGCWGPLTLEAVNECGPGLAEDFKAMRVAHYKAIAAAHPEKAVYLAGWTARAMR